MEPDLFPLDASEARVLGCLIEKAMTTPDQYPMSLNGVRVACNQVSNRDPVVDFDETTVATTLRRLADRGLAKFVHRAGDRVVKYIHAADDVLGASDKQLALLAVLLLRGSQTPGELRQRTNRYVDFGGLPEVETTLNGLRSLRADPLVEELERRPGQKERRWRDLVTQPPIEAASTAGESAPEVDLASQPDHAAPTGIEELRRQVEDLQSRFQRLLDALGVDEI